MILYSLVAYAYGFSNLLVSHALRPAHKKNLASERRHTGYCGTYAAISRVENDS